MGTSVTPPENLKTGAVAERTLFPVGGPVVSLFIFVAVWVAVVGEVVVATGMFKKGGRDEREREAGNILTTHCGFVGYIGFLLYEG